MSTASMASSVDSSVRVVMMISMTMVIRSLVMIRIMMVRIYIWVKDIQIYNMKRLEMCIFCSSLTSKTGPRGAA